MSDIAKEAWRKYLIQLQAHPLRTKATTSGILAGCSDAIAQKISGIKRLQLRRLLLIMLYGFAYAGPFGHFLHKLMDSIFRGKKDSTTTAKKVLLEQLTASPWNNMVFMMYYGLVVEEKADDSLTVVGPLFCFRSFIPFYELWVSCESGGFKFVTLHVGRSWALVKGKVRKDYPSVQLTAWKFWPIVSWVNYQYMPLQLRVLFHSFVASCWAIFLNLKARSAVIKQA